jgi:hypothetical protein
MDYRHHLHPDHDYFAHLRHLSSQRRAVSEAEITPTAQPVPQSAIRPRGAAQSTETEEISCQPSQHMVTTQPEEP